MVTARHAFRYSPLAGGILLLAIAVCGPGCVDGTPQQSANTTEVRLAWPQLGPFANALADSYGRATRTLHVKIVTTADPLLAIQNGQADITVTLAHLAYFAHRERHGDTNSSGSHVRAIAALSVVPMQLVVRQGLTVRDVADLGGHTVMSNEEDEISDLLFDAVGLTGQVSILDMPPANALDKLVNNNVDAVLRQTYYPNALVEAVMRRGGRLLSIEGPSIELLQRTYPFIRLATIPANTYSGQEDAIHTIGINMLYACRSDLDEEIVHALTQGFFEALPQLVKLIQVLRFVNVDRASSVPIPLHEGAARYYHELGAVVSDYPNF